MMPLSALIIMTGPEGSCHLWKLGRSDQRRTLMLLTKSQQSTHLTNFCCS